MRDDEPDGAMNYGLALAFDTNDPEFARGVELGRLWENLRSEPEAEFEQLVHLSNAEMMLRVGEALDRPVSSEEHDGTWMTVTFGPSVAETSLRG